MQSTVLSDTTTKLRCQGLLEYYHSMLCTTVDERVNNSTGHLPAIRTRDTKSYRVAIRFFLWSVNEVIIGGENKITKGTNKILIIGQCRRRPGPMSISVRTGHLLLVAVVLHFTSLLQSMFLIHSQSSTPS